MIEGQCQERVYHAGVWGSPQCSRAAVVDGKWCKQHDPGAVKARREKAAKKAQVTATKRNRARAEEGRDRLLEPVKGWVWCDMDGKAHRDDIGCYGRHRKLWVER